MFYVKSHKFYIFNDIWQEVFLIQTAFHKPRSFYDAGIPANRTEIFQSRSPGHRLAGPWISNHITPL